MVFMPPPTIYDAVKKATVAIVVSVPNRSPFPYLIVGSGFCIDPDGVIVTCNHVFRAFLTPETHERVIRAREVPGSTVPIHGATPHVPFYLGVQTQERRIHTYLVPIWKL
jgi:hypothetical protein